MGFSDMRRDELPLVRELVAPLSLADFVMNIGQQ